MKKMIAPSDLAISQLFDRVTPAIDSMGDSERSHPCAPNGQLDGCEPGADETPPTSLEIWKPTEPQYCKAICTYYGVKSRTVQKWAKRILDVCPWFDECEMRLADDRYTPLCIELMGSYYTSGLYAAQWATTIVDRFADRIAAQASLPLPPQETAQEAGSETPATESPSDRASKPTPFVQPLDLLLQPFDLPPTSVEVLCEDALTTKSLAQANSALVQGRSDLEAALLLVNQVEQLVQYTVKLNTEQSELEESQLSKLEDAVFDLTIHQDCLRREERATKIRRHYRQARQERAQSNVLKMRDFFAARAGSPVPEASQG